MKNFLGRLRLRTEQDGLVSTPFKLMLALFIGTLAALIAGIATDYVFKDSLTQRSQTIAASLDATQVRQLADTESQLSRDDYLRLKIKLARLKLVDQDARTIYILGQGKSGAFVVADSESPESPDYHEFGTALGGVSADVLSLYDNPGNRIETTSQDNGGRRLTAFSPVMDYNTGKVAAIAALDVSMTTYYSLLALSALVPIILTLAVCIIIVFFDRARTRRLETLRFRSELVSIASHELRTPLTGIRWSEEGLLHGKKLAKAEHDTVEQMYDSTLRLQESIEDILQLASLQNHKASHLAKAPADITTMINGIFSTQKLPASQHNIALAFDHDWPKDLTINCDTLRIKRVFNNIISNAIKYTRPHTTVSVGYEKIDGDHVITVTDQGIGIPKAEQAKVFSGFYRATNAVSHDTNGTGMGLYLSQTVVEQHGGKIWLKSTVNKGTTVFIRLP